MIRDRPSIAGRTCGRRRGGHLPVATLPPRTMRTTTIRQNASGKRSLSPPGIGSWAKACPLRLNGVALNVRGALSVADADGHVHHLQAAKTIQLSTTTQ